MIINDGQPIEHYVRVPGGAENAGICYGVTSRLSSRHRDVAKHAGVTPQRDVGHQNVNNVLNGGGVIV